MLQGGKATGKINRKTKRARRAVSWLSLVFCCLAGAALVYAALPRPSGLLLGLTGAAIALCWADRWMREEGGVPILTHHSVSAKPSWLPWAREISIPPELFERHLETLQRAGCTVIRTADLVDARLNRRPLPPRPVVLHFDDGYLDNWVAALPLLRRFKIPATMFVSLNFVEPGNRIRPTLESVGAGVEDTRSLEWEGYLNWSELRAIQSEGLVEVQPHGIDHGRVETGPGIVERLRRDNWRRLAWVQWRAMDGAKHDWFRHQDPPVVGYDAPVRVSNGAFAARSWSPDGLESAAAFEDRVRSHLRRSRRTIEANLAAPVRFFCWPENLTCERAREIAREEGFDATTAGRRENRQDEEPSILSRVHVGDHSAGLRWLWLEGLAFRATVRLFQGNYYWYFALLPITLFKRALAHRRPHAVAGPRPRLAEVVE